MTAPNHERVKTGVIEESQLPAYSEDGIDLTLIRWMLSLTPAERLETLQQHINSVLTIRAENSGG